jgi:hypothetical protein
LLPITCVTMAIKIESSTSVTGNDEEISALFRVCR